MPSRSSRLPVVLIALLALMIGVVGFIVLSNPATPVVQNGNQGAVPIGPELHSGGKTGAGDARADDAADRTGLVRESVEDPDASYRAALSGYKGRLVDHQRRPVAGRIMRFYRLDAEILQNPGLFDKRSDVVDPMVQIHEGRTDAAGAFLVTGAWPHSMYILEADVEGDDRLTVFVDRSPSPGEIVDLGDIQLVQLGVIVGRVVDEDGAGVPGAMVRAADIPGTFLDLAPVERFDPEGALIIREGSTPFVVEMPAFVKRYFDMAIKPRTVTDGAGRFRLRGVQPGDNVMVFNKSGLVPAVEKGVRVKAGKEKDVGSIRMKVGEEIFVKVVDTEDKPVRGAELLVAATTTVFRVDFAARIGTTDDKGELSAEGFPPGQITVAARRDENHPWVILAPVSVAADVVVKLPGRHHLDLTLKSGVGREVGNPQFKLLPSPDEGMPLDAGAMGFVKWLDVQDKVEELEDGRYRIGDLIPGKYTLAVTADGHAAAKLNFRIEKSTSGELTLPAECAFDVVVQDSVGAPISRAKIYVESRKAERGQTLLEMPIMAGETNRAGKLRVRDGEAGTFRISASHPAHGYAHLEFKLPSADPIVLRMEAPGQLSGVLTERGRPPKPGKWTIALEPRRRGERGAMPDLPKFTVPDLDGNFAALGMRPGKYRLRVIPSVSALTSPGGMIGFMMKMRMTTDTVTRDLVIEPGQPTFIEVDAIKEAESVGGPAARVSGTILVNGRPGKDMMVTARGKRRVGVTADPTGRFDLGLVPVGELDVSVRDPAQADVIDMRMENHLWRDRIQVAERRDVVLDISIETGGISGVVQTSLGGTAAALRVKATGGRNDGGRVRTSTAFVLTDAQGRFRFDGLPAGKYRIEVQDRQRGYGRSDEIEVQPASSRSGVTLLLSKTYNVTGTLDMSSFGDTGPRWSFLMVEGVNGAAQQGARVRRSGRFAVRGLPPGAYAVKIIFVPGDGGARRELKVSPGFTVTDKDLAGIALAPVFEPQPSGQKKQ